MNKRREDDRLHLDFIPCCLKMSHYCGLLQLWQGTQLLRYWVFEPERRHTGLSRAVGAALQSKVPVAHRVPVMDSLITLGKNYTGNHCADITVASAILVNHRLGALPTAQQPTDAPALIATINDICLPDM